MDTTVQAMPFTGGVPVTMTYGADAPKVSSAALKSIPYSKSKVFSFNRYMKTYNGFDIPEYNLYEISAAEDADGIIKQTIMKKSALMFKEGWSLTGKNPRTLEYIQKRFKQISRAQRYPMDLLLSDIGADLIKFHSAFIVILRDENYSGGSTRIVYTPYGKKNLKPVAAYFRVPPETMRAKTDEYGNIKRWLQEMPDGRTMEFAPENVIHFTYMKKAGFIFPTPGLWPALDDIKVLREMEEALEVLVHNYIFPLFVVLVGNDNLPARDFPDGTSEVDIWANKINNMPSEGGVALPHRVKVELLGFDNLLPIEKFLDYWKKRAYVSCGVSPVDMGEGDTANRSTADSMSKVMIDSVKDVQRHLKFQIEYRIIEELLLEEFAESVLEEKNIVEFQWHEIDIDSQMKLENHNWLGYSMHGITESEMRKRNKMSKIESDEDREDMYLHKYEKPKMEMETMHTIKINKAKPATGTGTAKKKSSTSKSKKVSAAKEKPSNQHGQKLGPEKRKSSMARLNSFLDHFHNSEADHVKNQVLGYMTTLDLPINASDICARYSGILSILIDEAQQSLERSPLTAVKDSLSAKIYKLIEQISEEPIE